MQSLSSIIKNTTVKTDGMKTINTDFLIVDEVQEENVKNNIESYENLARTMLENARRQSDSILSKAYEEAERLGRESYAQAFERGYAEGQEQGYHDAYTQTIEKATKEADALLRNANNILFSAKTEYEKYLTSKNDEIMNLVINIAETVIKSKLLEADGLNNMIFEVLNNSRNSETFIIRLADLYVEELKTKVVYWKERLGLKSEIFVVTDEMIEPGNAVIEKNNGQVIVGFDIGMESIRQALM